MIKRKVMLVIRDGWGYRESPELNAIKQAKTPFSDSLMNRYPNTLLKASGLAVGLPEHTMGNSEVGHTTIGAGRIKHQPLVMINQAIESGTFSENEALDQIIDQVKDNNATLHIMGLLQTQAVHSHVDHLFALLSLCQKKDLRKVVVHAFTDGRDAPVTESLKHMASLQKLFDEFGFGKVVTISGRYYAMDRDKRWERTQKAYDAIVHAQSDETYEDPMKALKESHAKNQTDEFIIPQVHSGYKGVEPGDGMIFFNYRTDRTRQLTKAIVEEKFEGWERKPLDVHFVAMTEFYAGMNAKIAFTDPKMSNTLGETVSKNHLSQLRISETEKYAHVTFFFNAQREEPYPNEDRILVDSPKVTTYDLKPEMSVFEIADRLVKEINKEKYQLIVVNLVNPDMVGHTGKTEAIVKAVEATDKALAKIVPAGLEHGYTQIVFADHGNAEDQTPEWRTSHTTHPVPCILVSAEEDLQNASLKEGKGLQDIAPTVLSLLHIEKPTEMTGENIVELSSKR